jgi:hypothetical protein
MNDPRRWYRIMEKRCLNWALRTDLFVPCSTVHSSLAHAQNLRCSLLHLLHVHPALKQPTRETRRICRPTHSQSTPWGTVQCPVEASFAALPCSLPQRCDLQSFRAQALCTHRV